MKTGCNMHSPALRNIPEEMAGTYAAVCVEWLLMVVKTPLFVSVSDFVRKKCSGSMLTDANTTSNGLA